MAEAVNPADWGAAPVDGPEHWGAVPADKPTTTPAQQMLVDFGNQGVAAGQRTTPVISAYGAPISDDVQERDDGAAMYVDPKSGEVVPTDNTKHVILRDPNDNKLKVFARSPETDEGVLASAGRLLGTGMAASPMEVSKAVPAAIGAAERIGVEVPKGIATDSPLTAFTAQVAARAPGGGPLMKAIEDSREGLKGAVATAAEKAGGVTDPAMAGDNYAKAIETDFKPTVKRGVSAAYDNLSQLVDPNKLTPLDETKKVTASIIGRRAESFIDGQGKAVDTVAEATRQPNGLTFDGIKGLRTHIGEMLDNGTFPEGMSENELRAIYGGLSKDLKAAAFNADLAGPIKSSELPQNHMIINGVPYHLNDNGTQGARIVQSIRDNFSGSRAVAALERANELNKQVVDWKEGIKKVLGPDSRSGEGITGAIIRAASNGGSADLETLAKARSAVPKEVWQDIASTAVSKLGTGRNGEWTPAAFVTDFRKLSDRGKALLFRSVGSGDVLPFLNDIAEVSQKFVDRGKLANTSGTAGHNALYATGGAVLSGLAHGSFIEPLTAIGGIAGINGVARLLARPATAASVARWSRIYNTYATSQAPTARIGLELASRNLANTAAANGVRFNPADLVKSITTPSNAGQSDQQDAGPPTSQ
jgi:hypothetical protein